MGRVPENAESIALVGGADDEVKGLRATMQLVTAAWSRVVSSQAWLTWLMGGNGVMAPVLPLLLSAELAKWRDHAWGAHAIRRRLRSGPGGAELAGR